MNNQAVGNVGLGALAITATYAATQGGVAVAIGTWPFALAVAGVVAAGFSIAYLFRPEREPRQ